MVMSQDPDNNIADRGFRIVGMYEAKLAAWKKSLFTPGSTVQSMLSLDGEVSEIAVTGKDYRNVET